MLNAPLTSSSLTIWPNMINSESLIHVVIDPYVLSIYDQDTVCRIADWIQWND